MKFLSVPRLQRLSSLLSHVDLGDVIVHARVEAYSCKPAGDDKRVGKQIERQLSTELAHSPHLSPTMSPLGPLTDIHTRKLLISLITTMNASFPDYDFSDLRAEQFDRELSAHTAVTQLNTLVLTALDTQQPGIKDEFWAAVGETVDMSGCELYRYMPSTDSELDEGALWSIHYFLFHRREKKVLFVSASAQSKMHTDEVDDVDEDEVDAVMSSSGNDWDDTEADGSGEVSGSIVWDNLEYGQTSREALARLQDEQLGASSTIKEVTDADSATLPATTPAGAAAGRRKARGGKRDKAAPAAEGGSDSKPRRKRKQHAAATPKAQTATTADKKSRRAAKPPTSAAANDASIEQPPSAVPAIVRADSDPEVGGRSLLDVTAASPSTSPLTVGQGILAMVEGQQERQKE